MAARFFTTLALCALSASAVAAAEYPATDQSGNVYPVECRRDLSDVAATVIRGDLGTVGNQKRLGLWSPSIGGRTDVIMIERNLSGWKYDDALRHERCHALMAKLYPATGGQWHLNVSPSSAVASW